ncbi:MAG: putative glycolipid-binding domain-containing protein [Chloroflexi bacterium]|nr:putative glycolipid-binding domain-containing protein [Chloroflexota bacterium]
MPATRTRAVTWLKEQPFGVEHVEVRLAGSRLVAAGVAIGCEPLPYRLDYRLETRKGFVTARLRVTARGDGWRRRLELKRSSEGGWSCATTTSGSAPLSAPGGDVRLLNGALDCDLGLSPLTNSPPVLRHRLLRGGGPVDFLMAWVSVPDLGVFRSEQRYTFVRADGEHSVVRYEDANGSLAADLTFDADGLVVDYPKLARRFS